MGKTYKERYKEKREKGECVKCKSAAVEGKAMCQKHLDSAPRHNSKSPDKFKRRITKNKSSKFTEFCIKCYNRNHAKHCSDCYSTSGKPTKYVYDIDRIVDRR